MPVYSSIKIIDFGGATYNDEYHTKIIETRHYRAPEVVLDIGWSFPADIWSVGCILVELYTGKTIFLTHKNREHLAMMEKLCGKFPKHMIKSSQSGTSKSLFLHDGRVNIDINYHEDGRDDHRNFNKHHDDFHQKERRGGHDRETGDSESSVDDEDEEGPLLITELLKDMKPLKELCHASISKEHHDFYELCRSCLEIDPSFRITPRSALKHPFFFFKQ